MMIYMDFYGFMNVFDDFVGTYPGHTFVQFIYLGDEFTIFSTEKSSLGKNQHTK